jgi:hypothetical protein
VGDHSGRQQGAHARRLRLLRRSVSTSGITFNDKHMSLFLQAFVLEIATKSSAKFLI